MSGPKHPGWDPDEPDDAHGFDHASGQASGQDLGPDAGPEPEPDAFDGAAAGLGDAAPADGDLEPLDGGADPEPVDQTGQTDAYSRAYSALDAEQFTSGPYVPGELGLYDYEDYNEAAEADDTHSAPRWPWIVGVAAIVAAIALVVSVSLLFARTDTTKLANPNTSTAPSTPPPQDEITTTKPQPPPRGDTPSICSPSSSSSAARRCCSTTTRCRRWS
ncbi:hypothetical protein A5714_10285 [Mycobacterium sp. E2462]|nr:hypothetical protein A5714_10285 [Mycobacterium sp. E2462]